jgi:hypothetical protein
MNPLAHFRHNVVAYLALFVALGTGTAFAAEKITSKDIAPNAVKSKHLKNGQVKGADLAANAVTGAKAADDSLTGADIDESTLKLQLPAPAVQPPAPPAPEVDLGGFVKVVARGYLSGVGPLYNGDRCNSVGTSPGSLVEDVVFTGAVNTDSVTYQACFTAASGEVKLNGDVRYMVLRMQE